MLLVKGLYLPGRGERLRTEEGVGWSVGRSGKGLGTVQGQDNGDFPSGHRGGFEKQAFELDLLSGD